MIARHAAALVLAAAPAFGAAADSDTPSVLVSYSFDDTVATGPDTFAVWSGARHLASGKGSVALSGAFHVSGYRSVEIRDVAGDGDFPELQGYFPARRTGRLFFHFAFLTTDARQELNVALAGPRFFQLEKDGIAFWLATRDGQLVHVSDSIPRKLFAIEPFAWYTVDVAYELAAGRYALTIHREGQERPLVELRDQPNAAKHTASAIDKFSFVGSPFNDRSNVVYYVDDVVIGVDERVRQLPFVAPGRRRLFVDLFRDYERLLKEKARCLPAGSPEDLGLTAEDLERLGDDGRRYLAEQVQGGDPDAPSSLPEQGPLRVRIDALADWSFGCRALAADDAARALPLFERAAAAAPSVRLYSLSAVLALARLRRFSAADERLALVADGRDDPRYAVTSAFVGVARGDLDRAVAWLRDPAARVLDREANPLLPLLGGGGARDALSLARAQLGDAFTAQLEETLVAEQYYYAELWRGHYDAARDYALEMGRRLGRAGIRGGLWHERAGDAAFYLPDLRLAQELYEQAVRGEKDNGRLMTCYLKLADLAYLAGDLETERRLREHYYGGLVE